MRVVLLGEYRAERLVSPLRRAGAEVVVLGTVDLRSCFEPDVLTGELPARLTDDALVSLLAEYAADLAIPNMNSPGQEQLLSVYARVGAERGAMPVHSVDFATLATDKVEFHEVAEKRGWPVPRGMVCADPGALTAALDALRAPVLVKEARSESHAGRHFVRGHSHLRQVSHEVRYPVLVQEAVTGEEFAVELFTAPSGTVSWPVASLGTLDGECAPGRRVRVVPASLPDRAGEALAAVVRDIVAAGRPAGPWQMDFAVSDGGDLHVIELNGRFGGLSNMSWVSTGVDPHLAHVDAVLGRPLVHPRPARVALELPVHNGMGLPPAPAGLVVTPFVGSPTNRVPLGSGYYRAVLGVPEDRAADARTWLSDLAPTLLLVDPRDAVAQLDRGVRSIQAR